MLSINVAIPDTSSASLFHEIWVDESPSEAKAISAIRNAPKSWIKDNSLIIVRNESGSCALMGVVVRPTKINKYAGEMVVIHSDGIIRSKHADKKLTWDQLGFPLDPYMAIYRNPMYPGLSRANGFRDTPFSVWNNASCATLFSIMRFIGMNKNDICRIFISWMMHNGVKMGLIRPIVSLVEGEISESKAELLGQLAYNESSELLKDYISIGDVSSGTKRGCVLMASSLITSYLLTPSEYLDLLRDAYLYFSISLPSTKLIIYGKYVHRERMRPYEAVGICHVGGRINSDDEHASFFRSSVSKMDYFLALYRHQMVQ